MSQMTKEAAVDFFSDLFLGKHHIPAQVKEWGNGWCVNAPPYDFSTFDFDTLTRLVFLAHDRCVRAAIDKSGPGKIKICIWQRDKREGRMSERHPTLEEAVSLWRKSHLPTTVALKVYTDVLENI